MCHVCEAHVMLGMGVSDLPLGLFVQSCILRGYVVCIGKGREFLFGYVLDHIS